MKAVALILALALVAGSHARAVPPNQVQWQEALERFWQYISDLSQPTDGVVKNLKTSQISRELDSLITDTMAELTKYREDIQTKVATYTDSASGQIFQDTELLFNKFHGDMTAAKARVTEYLQESNQNTDDVYSHMPINKLKKRLDKDTKEIRETMAVYLGEIQSRTSQNLEKMKSEMGELEPSLRETSEATNQKLTDLSTMLSSQVMNLGQELETIADELKTQLEATGQELRTFLDGKVDEVKQIFTNLEGRQAQGAAAN